MFTLFIFLNKQMLYNTRVINFNRKSWLINIKVILWYSMAPKQLKYG